MSPEPIPRFGCSPEEACAALGIGMRTLYGLIGRGEVQTRKLGKRTIIPVTSLQRLMDGDQETNQLQRCANDCRIEGGTKFSISDAVGSTTPQESAGWSMDASRKYF